MAQYVRNIDYLRKGKDGADAIYYEIVPDTFVVSLDADGNWAKGTNVVLSGGILCASVTCRVYEIVNNERNEYACAIVSDNESSMPTSELDVIILPTDTSLNVSAYGVSYDSGMRPQADYDKFLARITITVNRAGTNGRSSKIQFSSDGSSWHDTYVSGDKYMRIFDGSVWTGAIKFVGSDGTSFNPRGTALGHYEKTTSINGGKNGDVYIVDRHDYPPNPTTPCVVTFKSAGAGVAALQILYSISSLGDAYVVDGHLWVCTADKWVDVGNIQGPKGDSLTIVEKSIMYGISESGVNPSTVLNWSESIVTVTEDKPYLWTRTYVKYSDGNETTSYSVSTRGNRGPVFRQHTSFVDGEFKYMSGSGTEEFIDVVRNSNGAWYRCIKSYDSKDIPAGNNLANTDYWSNSGMTNMDFIATQLFLAQNATINMLGTNEINLYDSDSMFGSFRVPHNGSGVDGNVDNGVYALWLGAEKGENAPFRVKKSGAISATSGNIGSFIFDTYSDGSAKFYNMKASMEETGYTPASIINLNYRGVYVESGTTGYGGTKALGGTVSIGYGGQRDRSEFSWRDGLVSVNGYFAGSGYDGKQSAYYASVQGNSLNTAVAFDASAYGGKNNYAFLAEYGDIVAETGDFISNGGLFKGLRPNIRTTSVNISLSNLDCVVICTNSGEITLTFPSSPKAGQMYIVLQVGAKIFFNGNGKTFRGKLSGTKPDSNTRNQMSIFFWDGSYWSCFWAT